MCSVRENAISVNEEKQPYLVASQLETDYPLMVMGESQLLSKPVLFNAKIGVLASFGAEDDVELVPEIISLVINCESGWNQNARGLAGEIGIAQFMPTTWIAFNKMRGIDLDIYSEQDQLDMIVWAFDNGLAHHWSCWKQLQ